MRWSLSDTVLLQYQDAVGAAAREDFVGASGPVDGDLIDLVAGTEFEVQGLFAGRLAAVQCESVELGHVQQVDVHGRGLVACRFVAVAAFVIGGWKSGGTAASVLWKKILMQKRAVFPWFFEASRLFSSQ